MTFIPLWAFYGLAASLCAALMPLVQEKLRAEPLPLAVLVKLVTFSVTIPFALAIGLPDSPAFYAWLAASALLYSISDVIYYRTVAVAGAGVVSRLIPASVIGTFFLWFLINPALIDQYLAQPAISLAIIAVILFAVLCAMRLKQCAVSWPAARAMWFVLLAATIGPIITKQALSHAPSSTAPVHYVALQAGMMLLIWLGYIAVRRPVSRQNFTSPILWKAAGAIGLLSTLVIILKNYGYGAAEHPAYLSVIFFTDAVWILLIYRWLGKPRQGDIWAGLGIVASAAALVILKSVS